MGSEFGVKWRFGVVDKLTAPIKNMAGSFQPMIEAAKKADAQFEMMQKNTEKMSKKLNKIGGGFKDVGGTLTAGVTAPIIAFGAHALHTAVGFEESMNRVVAMTNATGKPLNDMRELAKKLGAETQFSASEAAEAMANLGQAGFTTQQIMEATPGLLNLAAASGADLARSAEIASSNIASFGLQASDAGRVADVFAQAAAASNVDIEDLAEAMKYAAPVAKQFGLSIEDTTSAMGLLGNVGIKGSMAGTTLKNVLLRLAAPASNARKLFNSLGIAVTDQSGKMLSMNQIFKNMGPALKKLPQSKQLAVLDKVFGKEAIAGAGELLNQALLIGSDGKNGIERFTESMENSSGAAERMAKQMMAGAPGAVKEFSSAFEGLELAVTDSGLLDGFTWVVTKITDVVRWMSQLSPWTLRIIGGFALLAAAVGPILFGLGVMITMIPSLVAGFALLKVGLVALGVTSAVALLPLLVLLAKFALLAGLAALIIANWTPIKAFFSDLFTDPLQQMKDMISYAGQLAKSVGSFFGIGDGKDDVDRQLEAQGFKIAPPSGEAVGADQSIQKSQEYDMRKQKASLDINFANMPKGTKVSADNRSGIINNMGTLGAI